ncbi:MAG: methyltransferase type 11 [Spirochaetaceae bacterium]|nr:methyltransferase type 11 [Spirochaetaceae bacterium]|tara:strand:+ start:27301 stop:28362 length:1062 start_codon:yes stop_codon:yes gene_type:complete
MAIQSTETQESLREMLQEFYGRQIQKTADLETNACCDVDTMAKHARVVSMVPAAATEKYLGCGSPIPDDLPTLKGLTALDLGSGSGVDAMILRFYLGPNGHMIGLDMTGEQLELARRSGVEFMQKLNYDPGSLEFVEGFMETADGIPDESVDLIISNCVVNLSPRKDLVFETMHRVLKPGGEVFFSDIVADRRTDLMDDEILVAECLGMAPYVHDARDMLQDAGFTDPRFFSRRRLAPNQRVLDRGDLTNFDSVIWRAFKLPDMDRRCEDYGQIAVYKGNMAGSPATFTLDEGHVFEAGRPMSVCRNTARMLMETRLRAYFEVTGATKHFGLFADCGTESAAALDSENSGACC